MEQIISKEELEKFSKIEGEVRGGAIRVYAEFILQEEGEEGLKKLEDAMAGLGFSIKYKKARAMDFFPIGFLGATLLSIKRLFDYDDQKFQEIGEFNVKASILLRFLVKYLISLKRATKGLPIMWRKQLTVGNLRAVELNEKERYLVLRIEDYALHPLHCQVFKGYFLGSLQMIIRKRGTCEETKCVFKGSDYHEFLIRW